MSKYTASKIHRLFEDVKVPIKKLNKETNKIEVINITRSVRRQQPLPAKPLTILPCKGCGIIRYVSRGQRIYNRCKGCRKVPGYKPGPKVLA